MRAVFTGTFVLAAMLLLNPAPPPVGSCPTSAGMKDASNKTKPSSFAPRPRPPNNAYGQPIGGKILTKHTKKPPELHTSPLP